ncbi:MAG: cbb3-type cytochrome c oxidase subunit 3 [Pseudomonadota bacterium]
MYDFLSSFAQTGGLLYFVAIFAGVLVYALWPSNQKTFNAAARAPLCDKEPGDD